MKPIEANCLKFAGFCITTLVLISCYIGGYHTVIFYLKWNYVDYDWLTGCPIRDSNCPVNCFPEKGCRLPCYQENTNNCKEYAIVPALVLFSIIGITFTIVCFALGIRRVYRDYIEEKTKPSIEMIIMLYTLLFMFVPSILALPILIYVLVVIASIGVRYLHLEDYQWQTGCSMGNCTLQNLRCYQHNYYGCLDYALIIASVITVVLVIGIIVYSTRDSTCLKTKRDDYVEL